MGICYVRSRGKVVITQQMGWSLGGLRVLNYPSLDAVRFVPGFDSPQKVAYVPGRELLAVSTRQGVELLSVAEIEPA